MSGQAVGGQLARGTAHSRAGCGTGGGRRQAVPPPGAACMRACGNACPPGVPAGHACAAASPNAPFSSSACCPAPRRRLLVRAARSSRVRFRPSVVMLPL
jgi:hypothetical protein